MSWHDAKSCQTVTYMSISFPKLTSTRRDFKWEHKRKEVAFHEQAIEFPEM